MSKPWGRLLGIVFLEVLIFAGFELGLSLIRPSTTYRMAVKMANSFYTRSDSTVFLLKPNASEIMWKPEFEVPVHINSHGYRGREFALAKAPGVTRVVMSGDSFTFGQGVTEDQTSSAVLSRLLNSGDGGAPLEVINAGWVGNTSLDTYAWYYRNHLGEALKPDVFVVNLFTGNDFKDMAENVVKEVDAAGFPLKIQSLAKYVDPDGFRRNVRPSGGIRYQVPLLRELHSFLLLIDVWQSVFPRSKDEMELLDAELSDHNEIFQNRPGSRYNDYFRRGVHYLSVIQRRAAIQHVTFLVVVIPAYEQIQKDVNVVYDHLYERARQHQPQANLADALDKVGIHYLDLLPSFQGKADHYYPQDQHWNAKGHALAASAIRNYFIDIGLTGAGHNGGGRGEDVQTGQRVH